MVNRRIFELIKDYPNINKVQSIEKDSLKDIKQICKDGNYDLAIIVRPLFIIALAVYFSGIKNRLGTGYRWYSFLFNIKHYEHRKYSTKHELEYNLDLLDELGCKRIENMQPKLNVSDELLGKVKGKFVSKGINIEKPFIIIHPGTLGSAKTWNSENFSKLIELLKGDKRFNYNIFVTGTKSEDSILKGVANRLGNKGNVYIINDLDIREFAALCKMSRLFVSNSTGPIHIAAAVGAFCVGFYSPVRQESAVRWAPFTDKKKIFSPEFTEGESLTNIMNKIRPEEVKNFIMNFLNNRN